MHSGCPTEGHTGSDLRTCTRVFRAHNRLRVTARGVPPKNGLALVIHSLSVAVNADSEGRRQWGWHHSDSVERSLRNRTQVRIRSIFWVSRDLSEEQIALVEVFIHACFRETTEAFYFRAQPLCIHADLLRQCF